MRPSLTGSEESVRDRVVEWEATLAKYTAVSGQDLSDDVKIAILLRSVAEVHQRYLMTVVSASASVSYSTVRDTFYQYLNSRQLWNPDAMDVNALWKGGGKSGKKGYDKKDKKGGSKGKTKDTKGKGKSGQDKGSKKFDGECRFCKKYGHKEQDCWLKQKQQSVNATTAEDDASTASSSKAGAAGDKTVKALQQIIEEIETEDQWVFGLRAVGAECNREQRVSSLQKGSREWVLLDSGSMVHACSPDIAGDCAPSS